MSSGSPLPTFQLCSFESRRAQEMSALIERCGGIPTSAPSMREIPLAQNSAGIQAIRDLIAEQFDAIILLTGVGTESLFELAETENLSTALLEQLGRMPLLLRGPKPAAALSRYQLRGTVRAAEPNTWRELIAAIDDSTLQLNGLRIAVQEYGIPGVRLYEALRARGAIVTPIPVYRWGLPLDTQPLISAVRKTTQQGFNALLFTSANQLSSVLQVAEQEDLQSELLAAVNSGTTVASIGPTCTEALQDHGWPVHVQSSPPKMGPLVRATLDYLRQQHNSPQ